MSVITVVLVVSLAVVGSQAQMMGMMQRRGCDSGYSQYVNNCYKFHAQNSNWKQAQDTCSWENANLISILRENERTQLPNNWGNYWTSGALENYVWKWTATGDNIKQSWFGRYPSTSRADYCAYFSSQDKCMYDQSCQGRHPFVCQKPTIVIRNSD